MAGRRDRGVGVGRSRAGSRPGAAAVVVACVVAALCAGAAARADAARAAGVAAPTPVAAGAAALGPLAAAVALQPAPAGWLRACRALVTRPACPALVQRTPLWADAEAVQLRRVNRSYGATSTILYADRRYLGELPVCAQLFDGVTHDYSRIVPACYARFAPARGLVAWISVSSGPILGTVHHEWKTRTWRSARLRDGAAAHHGFVPLDFGPMTWDGRAGRLLLGPRGFSEELVFVWGKGSAQRGVGIQVFEPLTVAAATLRALVAAVPRG